MPQWHRSGLVQPDGPQPLVHSDLSLLACAFHALAHLWCHKLLLTSAFALLLACAFHALGDRARPSSHVCLSLGPPTLHLLGHFLEPGGQLERGRPELHLLLLARDKRSSLPTAASGPA